MSEIAIGLLGIGTVGGGVLKIYRQNQAGLGCLPGNPADFWRAHLSAYGR